MTVESLIDQLYLICRSVGQSNGVGCPGPGGGRAGRRFGEDPEAERRFHWEYRQVSTGGYFSEVLRLFLMAFPLFRPPSPKRQAVDSVVSPAISTPSAPAESDGSGSARGQTASGLTMVPKFTRSRKFVLKHSSQ